MTSLTLVEAIKCYDIILIALIMFILDGIVKILSLRRTRLSPKEQELLKEYNEHVRIVNRLQSQETFVEQSKAIRKMNAIKKDMQQLAVERMRRSEPSLILKRFNQIRTPLLFGILMIYYWNTAIILLPNGWVLPLERILAFPGFPLGSISAVGWAGVCRRVYAKVLK